MLINPLSLASFAFLSAAITQIAAVSAQRFNAATKAQHLKRRDTSFAPRLGRHELMFAQDTPYSTYGPSKAARLTLNPKLPTVILDDLDIYAKDVQCGDHTIRITFHDESLSVARTAWMTSEPFLLLTSHPSCAPRGEHAAFLASYSTLLESDNSILLTKIDTTIRESTHDMFVEFGEHLLPDVDGNLLRRAAAPQTLQPSTTTVNIQTASIPPSVSLSFPSPTATATATSIRSDVSFSQKDLSIIPVSPLIAALVPQLDIGDVLLSCIECSMAGAIEIMAAGFRVNSSDVETVADFLDDGFIQVNANNLKAHVEMNLDLLPGFTVPIIEARLPDIPLGAIDIAGVIKFGPFLQLLFPLSVTLGSPVSFSFGFTLAVPDDSSLILNASDIDSSSSTGFQDTKLTPLPFNTTVENLQLNVSMGFRPQLVLTAGVEETVTNVVVNGGVGAFLDLPKLTASISTKRNVTDACNGTAPNGVSNTFIHVVPSAEFGASAIWELAVDLPGLPPWARDGEDPLFQKVVVLEDQCYLWDSKKGALVTSSNSNGAKNAANSLRRTEWWFAVTIANVVFIFVIL